MNTRFSIRPTLRPSLRPGGHATVHATALWLWCSAALAIGGALAGCSASPPAGRDAGAATDEAPPVGERGTDERFTWTAETVLDRTSGLTWQRHVDEARRSFRDADASCLALAPAGAWRMPTRDELLTILGSDAEPPVLGGAVDWYWSSTRSENVEGAAWVVGIARYTNTHAFETEGPVRCVR